MQLHILSVRGNGGGGFPLKFEIVTKVLTLLKLRYSSQILVLNRDDFSNTHPPGFPHLPYQKTHPDVYIPSLMQLSNADIIQCSNYFLLFT